MSRRFSILAFAAVTVGVVATGIGGAIASASLPDGFFYTDPYPLVKLEKTDRIGYDIDLPSIDGARVEEATVEWVIDCYDQYGPEGAQPDQVQLDRCMPSDRQAI